MTGRYDFTLYSKTRRTPCAVNAGASNELW